MLNSSLTSIENLRNNFANIKEEAIGLAKKIGYHPGVYMEFNNQISVLTQNNWNTWKHDMQVLLMHYGCWQFIIQTKPEQTEEEATYKEKLDLQLLPCNKSTDGKKDFRVVKIEAELILEANRLQLMKQDLEKAENAYLKFHFEEVEDVTWCYGCSSWRSKWQE
ncbi:uncharacterized protein TNCV_3172671 [Trichonephila clavipes]|nr:uncharacterized protein TNCV_3172671 [Trichonephila clavipes]